MLLLCFHVFVLLLWGESASGGTNSNAKDLDDLDDSFEWIPSSEEISATFGNNLEGDVHNIIFYTKAREPISQPRLFNVEATASHSTSRGDQLSASKTAYAQERSRMHSILPQLPFAVTRFGFDRLAIDRQKDRIRNAEKARKTEGNSYRVNREVFTACKFLRNRQVALQQMPLEHDTSLFEKMRKDSVHILTKRPSSYNCACRCNFRLHSPIDIDTDVELLASFVVDYLGRHDMMQEYENQQAFFDSDLLPALQHCEALFGEEFMPDDVQKNIKVDVEKEAALLITKGYEIRSDGEILDPNSNFLEFTVAALTARRLCEACDGLLSLHHKGPNTNVANNLYLLKDLHTLAHLMTEKLSHIKSDFKRTTAFLTVAPSVVHIAESLGFYAPLHMLVASFHSNGIWNIDEMARNLSSRIAQIKIALQGTDYRM